jgi:beta-lactam-binding protein with PASTA domain
MLMQYKMVLIFSFLLLSQSVCAQSSKKNIPIPNVAGMTLKEATKLLQSKNLETGAIIFDSENKNWDSAIVYKQNPSAKNAKGIQNFIQKGKFIDLWIFSSKILSDTLKKPIRNVKVISKKGSSTPHSGF